MWPGPTPEGGVRAARDGRLMPAGLRRTSYGAPGGGLILACPSTESAAWPGKHAAAGSEPGRVRARNCCRWPCPARGRPWPGRAPSWPAGPAPMRRRSRTRPRASCCAISATSRPGVRELRGALRLARQTGSPEREADVLATLGVALVYAGRTAAGLAAFDRAAAAVQRRADGPGAAPARHRAVDPGPARGGPGRPAPRVSVLRRAGDQLWTARALNARGRGLPGGRARPAARTPTSSPPGACTPGPARSWRRSIRCTTAAVGRLLLRRPPGGALLPGRGRRPVPAAERARRPALSIDRCAVLLAAGLASDALAEADAAIARHRAGPRPVHA